MLESTAPKPFVFVLMPFDEDYNDIYEFGIKAAANEAGGYCERLDEQIFEERMLDRIYNQINKADVIVADLTGKNPNVFYEVGYAHALEKKVDSLQTQIKENKTFFTERLDRLDNRIWTIVILTLGSLLASVLSIAVGM